MHSHNQHWNHIPRGRCCFSGLPSVEFSMFAAKSTPWWDPQGWFHFRVLNLKWITIRIYQIYHLESRWHNSFQIATFWELCHLLSLRYIYRCCLGSLHCSTRVCRLISMYDVWLARCLSYQHIIPYNTIFVTTCHHVINERVGLLRGIRTPSVDACTNAFVAFVNLFSTTYSKVSFPEVSIDTVVKKSKCMYTLTLAHQF